MPPDTTLHSHRRHFISVFASKHRKRKCNPPPTPPPKDWIVDFPLTYELPSSQQPSLPLVVYGDEIVACGSDSPTVGRRESPPPSTPKPSGFPNPRPVIRTPIHVNLGPEDRARLRREAQKQHELEEEEARRQEEERLARRKEEKEEEERRENQKEADRLATLQQELREATVRRRARHEEEERMEVQHLTAIREKKEKEKERRIAHTRGLEQWRMEYMQRSISSSSEEEGKRKVLAEERRNRIVKLGDDLLRQDGVAKGWVTIQTPDSSTWKRRFYKFDLSEGEMLLFPNHVDTAFVIDILVLKDRTEHFYEWYEGFEELEAMPHSFAVKFVDGQSWFMYADSEEEKDKLLLWLSEAGGIII